MSLETRILRSVDDGYKQRGQGAVARITDIISTEDTTKIAAVSSIFFERILTQAGSALHKLYIARNQCIFVEIFVRPSCSLIVPYV